MQMQQKTVTEAAHLPSSLQFLTYMLYLNIYRVKMDGRGREHYMQKSFDVGSANVYDWTGR